MPSPSRRPSRSLSVDIHSPLPTDSIDPFEFDDDPLSQEFEQAITGSHPETPTTDEADQTGEITPEVNKKIGTILKKLEGDLS